MEVEPIHRHISRFEIDQFIDGELSTHSTSVIETHLTICRPCRDEFRRRQLLFLSVNNVFAEQIPIPLGFAHAVARKAEHGSSMFRLGISPWTDLLIIWFAAFASLGAFRIWLLASEPFTIGAQFLPSGLTEAGGLVNLLLAGLEAVSIFLARFLLN